MSTPSYYDRVLARIAASEEVRSAGVKSITVDESLIVNENHAIFRGVVVPLDQEQITEIYAIASIRVKQLADTKDERVLKHL